MTHGEPPPDLDTLFSPAFWDERYSGRDHVWSGRPNPRLVEHAASLEPRRALDLGCGEGADSLWLAERGWDVLATDVSHVAVERAATETAGRPGAERITWQQADARTWTPPPAAFELVSMQYVHLPPAALGPLLDRLTASVTSGGVLLIVAHDPKDIEEGVPRWNIPELFSTAAQLAALLDPASWSVQVADAFSRPDGLHGSEEKVTVWDTVVKAARA